MGLLLPLLLLATNATPVSSVSGSGNARAVGHVTVTIIAAERIDFEAKPLRDADELRQYRRRDNMPMVEFY